MKKIERHSNDEEPFSALAFKVMTDPYVGKLTFFRVYSGTLTIRIICYTTLQKVNVNVLDVFYKCMLTTVKKSQKYHAGDIAAAVGLKDTTTGDTLCDEKNLVILESMEFPEPVIQLSVEPKSKADQDKMTTALQKLTRRRSNIQSTY